MLFCPRDWLEPEQRAPVADINMVPEDFPGMLVLYVPKTASVWIEHTAEKRNLSHTAFSTTCNVYVIEPSIFPGRDVTFSTDFYGEDWSAYTFHVETPLRLATGSNRPHRLFECHLVREVDMWSFQVSQPWQVSCHLSDYNHDLTTVDFFKLNSPERSGPTYWDRIAEEA